MALLSQQHAITIRIQQTTTLNQHHVILRPDSRPTSLRRSQSVPSLASFLPIPLALRQVTAACSDQGANQAQGLANAAINKANEISQAQTGKTVNEHGQVSRAFFLVFPL